jgi:hypothetical protein
MGRGGGKQVVTRLLGKMLNGLATKQDAVASRFQGRGVL